MWPSQKSGVFYSRITTRGRQEQASLAQSQASTALRGRSGVVPSPPFKLWRVRVGEGPGGGELQPRRGQGASGMVGPYSSFGTSFSYCIGRTPRPRAGRASGGHAAKAGGHRDTQLSPLDLSVCSGEGPTVEGSRDGERQNWSLGAKMGPKDGRCGLSSGPPGLPLKRLPDPSLLLLHQGFEPQGP